MARPDEAPLFELVGPFSEDEFVGLPEEALKPRTGPVQSRRRPAPSSNGKKSNNTPQAHSILYTPVHPALQKPPARRGRPPKVVAPPPLLGYQALPRQMPTIINNRLPAPSQLRPPAIRSIAPIIPQQQQQQQPSPSSFSNPLVQSTTGPPLLDQSWAPSPSTRFGGLPNFHSSLSNGTQPAAPMKPFEPPAQYMMNQQPSSSLMNNYNPRIPSILSSSSMHQQQQQLQQQQLPPAHRTFKPPGERSSIIRGTMQAPAPAHAPQPQQYQPQARTYNRMAATNSYQFVPQANPVRSAQEDIMRQISQISPNLNINDILHRVLTGQQPQMPPNEVNQEEVRMIKRQLEETMRSFSLPNSMPSLNNLQAVAAPFDINALNSLNSTLNPQQKKAPTEDEILKQDDDAEADLDEEYADTETYSDYQPLKLKIGKPHPDPVVETTSLTTVEPPDTPYENRLQFPKSVYDDCLLSALQLESIVYACQQHEQFLGDGKTRRGFLIGDGAGIGKGRTIAGIIYENFLEGRRKSVWLSVSPDLKLDAERDLRDIGAKHIPVYSMTKHAYGKRIDVPHGVLFSTYTGLVSKSQSVKGPLGTRLGQLVSWLGPNFDGVIVFDECHKAKNISITAKKKQSKTADFALEFQNKLPGARVVYASATGASETRHLGYMTRLGLWGKGTPYDEFSDFCQAIEKRGVGAMELVAVDLKMRGSYMARQLSFKTTSFDVRIATLDEKFIRLYDRCVDLWSRALQRFTEACECFSSDRKQVKRIWTVFWAAHQKFFKYLCIGAKVPLVIKIAKEALEQGKCVVIGLQTTGEAKTLEALEDGDINEFLSTAKATFESLVENHFPAPTRSRPTPVIVKKSPPPVCQEVQDTQGSSTDLSSTTLIDETFHSHEVVKFCSRNGLASAELEEDKAARELRQSSSRVPRKNRDEFKRRAALLEELAQEIKNSPQKSGRSLRARKRAKARSSKQSRIKKPIDESETETSTPTGSSTIASPATSEATETDDTYSDSDGSSSESTLSNSPEEDDDSPIRAKRSKKSSPLSKADILNSDSDSDIVITAVKPRQRNCEIIILSSGDEGDEDEEDDDESPQNSDDPFVIHGEKLSQMRDELLLLIEDIGPSLPHNTLDDLIDQLGGPDRVAEMTGRKGRVVKDEDGLISYRSRNEADALESLNIAEKERFMRGEKLVAIISEAASSGISLQADRRAENKLRRVHITIELPWSADRAIQQFGRTHRSNQVTGPEYVFVISELSGEKRFASIVAKRLESLGALTHGDRKATSESRDLSQFNLSGRFCRQAIEQIIRYIEYGTNDMMAIKPDYNGNFLIDARKAFLDSGLAKRSFGDRISIDPATVNVNHFLNRLLGMKVGIQNSLFRLFTSYTDRLIARKKANDDYDAGILVLNFGKTTCFPPEDYALKTRAGIVKCTLRQVQVERGISWQEAKKIFEAGNDKCPDQRSGFYMAGEPSSKMITLFTRQQDSVDLFRICKPNTGHARKSVLFDIHRKGRKCSMNEAQRMWERIYNLSANKCSHLCYFEQCKRREAKMKCDVGLRHLNYCILSGGILTAWPYIERKCPAITDKVRLVRLRKDDNTNIIGPVIPQLHVERVKQILGEGARETIVF